jgi:hypothetical protein
MQKVLATELKVGDVIMPPAREVQLWMARAVKDRGLSDAALHLTITKIYEGVPDKRGRWLVISADQSAEWNAGRNPQVFKFKARPETPWAKVAA